MSLLHILFLACLVTTTATSTPCLPPSPVRFLRGGEGRAQQASATGREPLPASPLQSIQQNSGEGRGVRLRSASVPAFWASFFGGINYLLAHFSKAFCAAIFHLFPLFLCVLFHTCHRGILGWKTFISSNIGFCFTMLLLCLQQPHFLLLCTYLYCWVITQVNFLSCHAAIWHKVISLITGVIF